MHECNPEFDFDDYRYKFISNMVRASGMPLPIHSIAPAIARLPGTLNQFSVKYSGRIELEKDKFGREKTVFHGVMQFYDKYDFDEHGKDTQRSFAGQFKTGVGSVIQGIPFKVRSEEVKVTKESRYQVPIW